MYAFLLITHVFAGMTSLLTGLIAMRAKKGGKLHLQMGRIYYFNMLYVVVSVIPMHLIKPNYFLLLIAFFSFYFLFMGKRVLKYKDINLSISRTDINLVLAFIILGSLMFLYGLFGSLLKEVMLIFGVAAVGQGIVDYRSFTQKDRDKSWWLGEHINKIGSSYIAATTAFVVQNAYRFTPNGAPIYIHILIWVGPGVIGSILIARAVKKYSTKKKPKSKLEVIAN